MNTTKSNKKTAEDAAKNARLEQIAKTILDMETLETRHSDRLSIFLYRENCINRNLLVSLCLAILTRYNLFLYDENCSSIVRTFSGPTNGQTSLHPRFRP